MSEDLIRREDLFELMMRHKPIDNGDGSKERYAYIEWLGIYHAIRELPSADRPQGKWKAKSSYEYFCNNCGFSFDIRKCDFLENMKHCPNCGVRKGADDE